MKVINELYEVVSARKSSPEEGSYTCYLFEQGLDKILKKLGEECSETIIAAKNRNEGELTMEICDLIYHLLVLMANENLPLKAIEDELVKRRGKIANLKPIRKSDKNT
jgi:phosphoribosyl-ATP pyrophosphohydrolase